MVLIAIEHDTNCVVRLLKSVIKALVSNINFDSHPPLQVLTVSVL